MINGILRSAGAALLLAGFSTAFAGTTLVHAGELLAVAGELTARNQTIVIEDDRIVAVRSIGGLSKWHNQWRRLPRETKPSTLALQSLIPPPACAMKLCAPR